MHQQQGTIQTWIQIALKWAYFRLRAESASEICAINAVT